MRTWRKWLTLNIFMLDVTKSGSHEENTGTKGSAPQVAKPDCSDPSQQPPISGIRMLLSSRCRKTSFLSHKDLFLGRTSPSHTCHFSCSFSLDYSSCQTSYLGVACPEFYQYTIQAVWLQDPLHTSPLLLLLLAKSSGKIHIPEETFVMNLRTNRRIL
jgi:hypothetical protein